jgi:hypothetical protein
MMQAVMLTPNPQPAERRADEHRAQRELGHRVAPSSIDLLEPLALDLGGAALEGGDPERGRGGVLGGRRLAGRMGVIHASPRETVEPNPESERD